ncbi:MAG TPA: PIN domain-containing protein [Candidatus Saccharimonadales bacterium]|nr:PIN domain-containing protein [Candidatus Saccharimonadales bacterium]
MPLYLADSSIWAWANKGNRPDLAEKLADRLERDEIATCTPVALEVMHRAETNAQYEELFSTLLEPVEWLELDLDGSRRALEVQRELAAGSHGNHRRPAVDYLIAATAEQAGEDVVLWFFDEDLRVICEHTGQSFDAEESTGPGR